MSKIKLTHGGSRPPVRPDDGRLVRKLVEPVRKTIILEQKQLDWLGQDNLSEKIRDIIDKYIERIEQ